jgi:murein DD-endopeptidase MepM/ murein hydrolase activator NlpD
VAAGLGLLLLPAGLAGAVAMQHPPEAGAGGQPMTCAGYHLSQDYGPVSLEAEPPLFGFPHFHSGWDLVCPAGTAIVSVSAGLASVQVDRAGYGISVLVSRGDLHIRYAHLALAVVASGQDVLPGQELGRQGSTGNSTGPHLHFEVDQGCPEPRCSIHPAAIVPHPAGLQGR